MNKKKISTPEKVKTLYKNKSAGHKQLWKTIKNVGIFYKNKNLPIIT